MLWVDNISTKFFKQSKDSYVACEMLVKEFKVSNIAKFSQISGVLSEYCARKAECCNLTIHSRTKRPSFTNFWL